MGHRLLSSVGLRLLDLCWYVLPHRRCHYLSHAAVFSTLRIWAIYDRRWLPAAAVCFIAMFAPCAYFVSQQTNFVQTVAEFLQYVGTFASLPWFYGTVGVSYWAPESWKTAIMCVFVTYFWLDDNDLSHLRCTIRHSSTSYLSLLLIFMSASVVHSTDKRRCVGRARFSFHSDEDDAYSAIRWTEIHDETHNNCPPRWYVSICDLTNSMLTLTHPKARSHSCEHKHLERF